MSERNLDLAGSPPFARFSAALGQSFDLMAGEVSERLTLTEATPSGAPYAEGAREPFSLLFKGTTQTVLPQGIWRMRNAALGELDIFLVPIARDPDGTIYQAVFN